MKLVLGERRSSFGLVKDRSFNAAVFISHTAELLSTSFIIHAERYDRLRTYPTPFSRI